MNVFKRMIVVLLLAQLFLLPSCQGEGETELPPIVEKEMVDILTEALILEPALREVPKKSRDSVELQVYERILENKGYSIDDFTESMMWLQAEPKRLTKTYEEVMAELTRLEVKIDEEKKKEKEGDKE